MLHSFTEEALEECGREALALLADYSRDQGPRWEIRKDALLKRVEALNQQTKQSDHSPLNKARGGMRL